MNDMNDMNDLKILNFMENFCRASQLPLHLFDGKTQLGKGMPHVQDFNLPMLIVNSLPENLPSIWYSYTPEYLYFGAVTLPDQKQFLLLGPILMNSCSRRQGEQILQHLGRSRKDLPLLLCSFDDFRICSATSLIANLSLIYQYFYHTDSLPVEMIPFQWKNIFPPAFDLSLELAEEDFDTDLEDLLISCVRYGKSEEINRVLTEHVLFADKYKPMKNRFALEQQRSYILGANVLASRAALAEGADYDQIYRMSGHYVNEIMRADNVTDLGIIFFNFFLKYTRLVARLKSFQCQNALSAKINSYIQSHLYEKLTPAVIADALHRNCSYLCAEFKADTKKTISTYIQECKIEEACHLLENSALTTAAVSQLLCFSSQSYFGSVFKKIKGMTPGEYQILVQRR